VLKAQPLRRRMTHLWTLSDPSRRNRTGWSMIQEELERRRYVQNADAWARQRGPLPASDPYLRDLTKRELVSNVVDVMDRSDIDLGRPWLEIRQDFRREMTLFRLVRISQQREYEDVDMDMSGDTEIDSDDHVTDIDNDSVF